jgi:hypothetical protein
MEEKQYDVTINAVLILGIKFSMVLYASLHWVGCFCYMVAGLNNNDETTWTAYISANVFPKFDYHQSTNIEKYIVLMFKSLDVITLTGICDSRKGLFYVYYMSYYMYIICLIICI